MRTRPPTSRDLVHDVTIQSSYIHDSLIGVWLVNISSATNPVTLVDNTFIEDATALLIRHLVAFARKRG